MATSKIDRIIYTIIVIVAIMLLSLYFFWDPVNSNFFPKCPFYSITELYCPGCGSQRALHQLTNGHIIAGLKYNLLIVLLVLVITYQIILWIVKATTHKSYSNVLHKPLATKIILVIIILFWILRNIDMKPFNYLAP